MSKQPDDMPASFRAQLDARLAQPLLLDPRHFDAVHALAGLKPRADFGDDEEGDEPEGYVLSDDGLAAVSVEGPLAQRAWSCWMFGGDGYDAITARMRAALADDRVRCVLLVLDSPGGEVAGCFEAVRAIQAAIEASGKPVVAYVDELAASAAYALACVASKIVVPDTGCVGSIGVIASVADRSKMLRAAGVEVSFITSGARKADGRGEQPFTDDARAALQAQVDHLAGVFFDTVAQARGLAVGAVKKLEAGVRYGAQAVTDKLADQVGTLDDAAALARSMAAPAERSSSLPPPPPSGPNRMENRMKNVIHKLGLDAGASEGDVLVALDKRDREAASVYDALGAKSAGEALGVALSLKQRAEAGDKASAALKTHLEAADKAERAALLERGKAEGRVDAAMEALLNASPLEAVRAFVGSPAPSKPLLPPTHTQQKSSEAKHNGKAYEQLTFTERASLAQSNKPLHDIMRADAESRGVDLDNAPSAR